MRNLVEIQKRKSDQSESLRKLLRISRIVFAVGVGVGVGFLNSVCEVYDISVLLISESD